MFGGAMAVVVAGLSVFVYARTGSDLLATVDADLASRADLLAVKAKDDGPSAITRIKRQPAFAFTTRSVYQRISHSSTFSHSHRTKHQHDDPGSNRALTAQTARVIILPSDVLRLAIMSI
jgi:hypothetical protein